LFDRSRAGCARYFVPAAAAAVFVFALALGASRRAAARFVFRRWR